jgi:hypothetical protein
MQVAESDLSNVIVIVIVINFFYNNLRNKYPFLAQVLLCRNKPKI